MIKSILYTYIALYIVSCAMEVLNTKTILGSLNNVQHSKREVALFKFVFTYTKILLIMEVYYFFSFVFLKNITNRAQTKFIKILSIFIWCYVVILTKCGFEKVSYLILQIITLIFFQVAMRSDTDIIYHLYNLKIGADINSIRIYIVEEVIDSCKKAAIIWISLLILTSWSSAGKNPFVFFYILRFLVLYIDLILSKIMIDTSRFYLYSTISMGMTWFFGMLLLIPLIFKYGILIMTVMAFFEAYIAIILFFLLLRYYLKH